MKKASLMAIIFACFTFAFTMPAAYAHRDAATGNAVNNNDTTGDVNRGLERLETGIDRGVDRATDLLDPDTYRNGNGNGIANNNINNRARTYGVGDNNGYRTNMNRTDTNRANMRTNGYRATAAADNDGIDWGWLGLLGLIGLAGMRNRDRDRA